jgi:gliding motility-associated-like protein
MQFKSFLPLVAFMIFAYGARAEHLVGGEIFYECLGNDEYQITLKVYRDCYSSGAPFDSPANLAIYNSSGDLVSTLQAAYTGSQQLEVIISNPCLQAPPEVCVEEAIYTVNANLPFLDGGYHIAYQRCCRNQSIVNLINPDAQGSTYYVEIPEIALNSCNSSPSFNNFPPLALCIGDQIGFDHAASDLDSDQLVYSLCTPFHGGTQIDAMPIPPSGPPYSYIDWGAGYSSNYPIDASQQLTIDPTTGWLDGVPSQVGQYVVGVCVEEFRNGQLLSVNKRDFQFNVVNCESNIAAIIPAQDSFHDPCDGLEVDFGNSSINAQYYHWDFGVSGMQIDTSDIETPNFLFPDTGSYSVTLIANPGYPCADTTIDIVTVYNDVTVEIQSSGELCFDVNEIDFEATGQFGSGATFYWEFEDASPEFSTDQNPQNIVFDTLGTFNVSVIVVEHICSDETDGTIQTYPRPDAYFNQDSLAGCAPLGVLLIDSSFSATDYLIEWNLGDGNLAFGSRVLHEYVSPGFYDLELTIWTASGCIDTVSYSIPNAIEVYPVPGGILNAEPDTQFIFDPSFEFDGSQSSAISCQLFPGDGMALSNTSQDCWFEYFYSDTGNFEAIMIFTDDNGCISSDTVTVRVEPEVRFWIPNAFTPNEDRINDTWGPKAFGFGEYEIWVYDRWGKLMFHSLDPLEKWNGTYNNQSNHKPVLGVYSYRILALSVKNQNLKESGHVTILK